MNKTIIFLTFFNFSAMACDGKSDIRADADKVFESSSVEIYKLTKLDYSKGCLEWGISNFASKDRICNTILGKGFYRGYDSAPMSGHISHIAGSTISSKNIPTVHGNAGIQELLCTVVKSDRQ